MLFALAQRNLTSKEAMLVADDAFEMNYSDAYIKWLQGALYAAKSEGKEEKFLTKIK